MLPQPLPLDSAAAIPLDRGTYAFTNLVQRFGWLTGLAAVLLALLLFCRSAKYCTRTMPPAQSGAGMALLLFAAVNTFTSATTGMGLLPGIGAHFLFLDSSGSFYAAACLILVYLLGCGTPVRPRLRVHLRKLSVGLMAWTIVLIISAGWLVLK